MSMRSDSYTCECHRNMGNDFYFLPTGSCLRRDGKCDRFAVEREAMVEDQVKATVRALLSGQPHSILPHDHPANALVTSAIS